MLSCDWPQVKFTRNDYYHIASYEYGMMEWNSVVERVHEFVPRYSYGNVGPHWRRRQLVESEDSRMAPSWREDLLDAESSFGYNPEVEVL